MYWSERKFPQQSIFWIHASTHERFVQAFTGIAKELNIPESDEPNADVLSLVKYRLAKAEHGNWLMVLDNADDADVLFGSHSDSAHQANSGNLWQYIPECSHGSLLVTTRHRATGSKLTRSRSLSMIKIGEMDPTESSQLICAKLEILDPNSEKDDVNLLAQRLDQLPLALAQAAAFIQENGGDIAGYLQILDESDQSMVDLLSEPFIGEGRDSSVPNAIIATWIVSF